MPTPIPTRRRFMQTLASAPVAAAAGTAWAAPDASRVALVIGNSAYAQSPLVNPGNDAAASRDLFTAAGFSVQTLLDARRDEMLAAIERFGEQVQRPETRLAVFYYAGHGVQQDWRNYLLPVDAAVQAPDDIKAQCVDLGVVLGKMAKARDRTYVIILDACRDDPFKGAYRPPQKGLSQFDAPVGSLLAYATAPGNTAADGSGKNGLYTEHLVQELSNRQTRLEDALKRVRLKVRLASQGQQVPWETTSLEGDVFVFPEGESRAGASEATRAVEADLAEWTRLKGSRQAQDWQNYLLKFPQGRFAEIAQRMLDGLLADAAAATAAPAQAPLVIQPGRPFTLPFKASDNPNSAGRFPLGRKFTVGDEYGLVLYDLVSRAERRSTVRVSHVDTEADRVELNDGAYVWDSQGNIYISPMMGAAQTPRQFFPAELYIGKKWTAGWTAVTQDFQTHTFSVRFQINTQEKLKVPAGEFLCFLIEFSGNDTLGRRVTGKSWVIPGLNVCVKQEILLRNRSNYGYADGYMLAWARQQGWDPA